VRHVEIKEKSKMISHIAPTDMLVGRYNNSNSLNSFIEIQNLISQFIHSVCRHKTKPRSPSTTTLPIIG